MITNVSLTGLRDTREMREHIVGEHACEAVSRAVFCDCEGQAGRPEPQFGKVRPTACVCRSQTPREQGQRAGYTLWLCLSRITEYLSKAM